MDMRQLRYFLTVVKEGQITRAAKKLNMTQPPLSQQLKLMEEELGTTLLERNGGKIQLTGAGKILYRRAEHILSEFENVMEELKETAEGLRGELLVGAVRYYAVTKLPQSILTFRKQYPHVTYKIWEGDPARLTTLLENREIELAIIRFPANIQIEVETISLLKEPYVICLPKQWEKYSQKTSVYIRDIKDIPLMLVHNNNKEGTYEKIINEWRKQGFNPNIICECPDASVLLALVAAGIGATILPKSAFSVFPTNDVKILDIIDSTLQSETKLVWSKGHSLSKVAERFIETFHT